MCVPYMYVNDKFGYFLYNCVCDCSLLVQELGGFYLCFVYQKVVWYQMKALCL